MKVSTIHSIRGPILPGELRHCITLACGPAEADAAWRLLTTAAELPRGGVHFICAGRPPIHVNRDGHGRLKLTPSPAI